MPISNLFQSISLSFQRKSYVCEFGEICYYKGCLAKYERGFVKTCENRSKIRRKIWKAKWNNFLDWCKPMLYTDKPPYHHNL